MDNYIGKMLDNRYEILEVIGTGGMAVVYKARCHRLNRYVAVKILKDELAQDAEFRRRFHAESQAVAMLSHPNIVSVYDVSRSSQVEYIVMELIDGITLKQYMERKGQLSWKEALHFVTQIAKGLSHAHSRGIIHRDIKPHNIMILRDGSVKVADFGIARLTSTQNTLTQEALGSVHYISPEQARGSYIDERSDIYSVGVVLYEMITSRLPYEGDSPVSVAIQHINSIPLTPREINPDIPEALELITMKAMAPDMDKRYESADEMLEDLEEFRKNPNISFEYKVADFIRETSENEPTRVISSSQREKYFRPGISSHRRERDYESEDMTSAPGSKPQKISLLASVILVLAFIGVIFYFLWTSFLSDLFATAEEYKVPNLIGKSIEDVLSNPDYNQYFNIVEQGTRVSSDEYEEGEIIDQTPVADRTVRRGAEIQVTVSSGKEEIAVPEVVNKEYRTAQQMIKDIGLVTDTSTYENSASITEGYVISVSPGVGTSLSKGDTVHLVISLGPRIEMVTVPAVIGQSREAAETMLTQAGLKVGDVELVEDESASGTVIYQSIKATSEVEAGSKVDLKVSRGPTAAQTPDAGPEVSSD